uniref:Proteasome subunit beta type n=1 Tax=Rhizophora mucronata TaxID=61149 RepID=A0A2P2P0V5_RHIMU
MLSKIDTCLVDTLKNLNLRPSLVLPRAEMVKLYIPCANGQQQSESFLCSGQG